MIKTRKQMFIIIGVFALILFLGSTTYAWFNYRTEGGNNSITAGDIYLTMSEGNETLTLTNIFPETKEEARARNDNYITFTVSALNESDKDIYYEIELNHGEEKPSPKSRFRDYELVFDLVELDSNNNEVRYVVDSMRYNSIEAKKIWVDVISKNSNNEVSKKYKLRAWLSSSVIISDSIQGATYTTQEYANKYATVSVKVYGDMSYKEMNNSYTMISKLTDTETEIDFGANSSATNGEGIYLLKDTDDDNYPIYYYRGNVNNNNVIFGGYCWQILRTTDTGGIKLVYNGEVTGNGTTCTNSTHETRVLPDKVRFTTNCNTMSGIGYMNNKAYMPSSDAVDTGSIYGNKVEWHTDHYLVIESTANTPSTWTSLDSTHHYTCGTVTNSTPDTECDTVRYYYNSTRYIVLSDGEDVEDALYKMTGTGSDEVKARAVNQGYVLNKNDSLLKTTLENWFKTNLTNEVDITNTNYQDYIEDTVFCNERSFSTDGSRTFQNSGWNYINGSLSTYLYFGVYSRIMNNNWYSVDNVPTMTCPNITDRFSVGNPQAKLNYPVGLLTKDEQILAGICGGCADTNSNYYLYTGGVSWFMTPMYYGSQFSSTLAFNDNGSHVGFSSQAAEYVRPVISLKYGVEFVLGGEGTPNNPYVVKYVENN